MIAVVQNAAASEIEIIEVNLGYWYIGNVQMTMSFLK